MFPTLLAVVVMWTIPTTNGKSTFDDVTFSSLPARYLTVETVGSISAVSTASKCGVHCFSVAGCTTFLYDSSTRECHYGSDVLYHTNGTPTSRLYALAGSEILVIIPQNLTFAEAEQGCKEFGARLFTMDSVEALTLLSENKQIVQYPYAWIGLTDLEQEGVYRWLSDGSVLDDTLKNALFLKYQPDNWRDEDCIDYEISGLNDASCSVRHPAACELFL